ncbi:hypothetical protein [Vibrio quintilis]|nr:hypothetical protein [Vibrio quintilis]
MISNNLRDITVTEDELLIFFESEPERANYDPVWLFDDSVYRYEFNNIKLSFSIIPNVGDIRLILFHHENMIYEFNAMSVKDVKCFSDMLTIYINHNEFIDVILQPSIRVKHRYKGTN